MIVVDTNVIVYLTIGGVQEDACKKLLEFDQNWSAPPLWREEFSNVLVISQRQGELSYQDALSAYDDAVATIDGRVYDVEIKRILAVAARTGCSGYDAQYIALAEDLALKLYTFDKRVLTNAPEIAVRPE